MTAPADVLCPECHRHAPPPGERCRCGHEIPRHLDVRLRVDQLRDELVRTDPGPTRDAIEADLADALRAHLEPTDPEDRRRVLARVRADRAQMRQAS